MTPKFDPKEAGYWVSLGREVANKHSEIKDFAYLGNAHALKRAKLRFIIWLEENPDKDLFEEMDKAIELLGQATLLEHVKEVGRMCLALGDTTKHYSASKWKEKAKDE